MRIVCVLLVAAALVACGQSAQTPQAPLDSPAPAARACNDVSINPAVRAEIGAMVEVSTAPALLGGPIAPGTYDLVRIAPQGGSTPPSEAVWESLRVRESESGVTLDFAVAIGAANAAPIRSTARLEEGPPARLIRTCGGEGASTVSWEASGAELRLVLPGRDGRGQDSLTFARRAG